MNNRSLTADEARNARVALGVSQNFIARESGINRSQLALFEIGKYNLEPYKRLTLRDCYERLGYRFGGNEAVKPAVSIIPAMREPALTAPMPRMVDGITVRGDLGREEITRVTAEIADNDERIERLAQSPVKNDWWKGEPITCERDAILQLMARNYQLIRHLQHRMPFPPKAGPDGDNDEKSLPPQNAADMVTELLAGNMASEKSGSTA